MLKQAGKTSNIASFYEFFYIRREKSGAFDTIKKSKFHNDERHKVKETFLPENRRSEFHLLILLQESDKWIVGCSPIEWVGKRP
jgi:hypothetical protein